MKELEYSFISSKEFPLLLFASLSAIVVLVHTFPSLRYGVTYCCGLFFRDKKSIFDIYNKVYDKFHSSVTPGMSLKKHYINNQPMVEERISVTPDVLH
jgi:hypothetical protein